MSLILAALPLLGCVSFKQVAIFGSPLDEAKVGLLQPGATTVDEVLGWLGPPDFIVDGSKRLIEAQSLLAGYAAQPTGVSDALDNITARVISADEGTMIFIYTYVSSQRGGTVGGWGVYAGRFKAEVQADEIFVVISKQDLKIREVIRRKNQV